MYPYGYGYNSPYYSSSPSPDRTYVIRRRRSGSSWGSTMSGRTWVERNSRGDPVLVRKKVRYDSGLSSLADAFTSRPRLRGRSVSEEIRVISDPPPTQVIVQSPPHYGAYGDPGMMNIVTNPDQALVTYPPPPFPLVHAPYSNKLVSPHRAEGKHTCGACGKFRSPSYHARHPLAPGQVPAPSLCQRCRSVGTDSSENSITNSDLARKERKFRKRLKRARSIRSMLDSDEDDRYFRRTADADVTRRPRSLSRVEVVRRRRSLSLDSFDDSYDTYARRYYRSSSLDARPIRVSTVRSRRDRSLSLSPTRVVERVRYVDGPPSPLLTYSPRRRLSRYSNYDEDDEWEDVVEEERDVVYRSRPRFIRRRSSTPMIRRASSTRFRYRGGRYPERVRDIEETETRIRSRSRPPSRSVRVVRVSADDSDSIRRRNWDSDDDRRRVAFVSSSPRGRSKTRETVTVQDSSGRRVRRRSVTNVDRGLDDDHYSPPERISELRRYRSIEAPSPPPAAPWNPQRRYLATRPYDDTAKITRTLERTRLSPSPVRRRVVSTALRRTRSRSLSGPRSPLRRRRSRSGFVSVAERSSYPGEMVTSRRGRRVRVREV